MSGKNEITGEARKDTHLVITRKRFFQFMLGDEIFFGNFSVHAWRWRQWWWWWWSFTRRRCPHIGTSSSHTFSSHCILFHVPENPNPAVDHGHRLVFETFKDHLWCWKNMRKSPAYIYIIYFSTQYLVTLPGMVDTLLHASYLMAVATLWVVP